MPKPKVAVAQLGARKHYQEPLLIKQWGMLDTLYTDFYAGNIPILPLLKQPIIVNRLPQIFKQALERYEPGLNSARVIHFPVLAYQYAQKLRQAKGKDLSSIFIWANSTFNNSILQRGLGDANVIYGFNGASLELFQYAKQQGIKCILDQTLAERSLVHQLMVEEENFWDGWSNLPFTVSAADLELAQREQQEQDLADHIICGSQFVKDSLIARGVESKKITVVALGRIKESQTSQNIVQRSIPKERGDGLRILFAGEVGLRKGIPYLLEALKQLKEKIPFTCKIAGGISIHPQKVAEYSHVADFLGRVTRSRMAKLYAWADVFVLPSICEGSAMVTYEALNWKLPIITTNNAGSVVRNGVDGFLVPIRTLEDIAHKLLTIYGGEHQLNLISTQQYWNNLQENSQELLKQAIVGISWI
ncbi:glycosyltransferase family 4 protein [Chrysosporum ovalisporum FSS-45]|uniref:glycosyltransferase family 4 protein n=1 Tax=Umezakia ovalisporum TaxID=75695 RepID=UPI00247658B6|nr:glycosyltransferase family 4 protein [Umezakia ovalisporum]MDH6076671.1 glycosyltransferase family 4 protein [Umezakia ovalisporum FSS-45]